MRKSLLLLLTFAVAISHVRAQTKASKYKEELQKRSAIWNTAFVQRDIPTLTSLLSEDAQMASAGGKWKTRADCARLFESLFEKRPDITFIIKPKKFGIDPVWKAAYETGNWTEA